MDYESYRRDHFVDPRPTARFDLVGVHGVALYFADYQAAVDYYTEVLGPPIYREGDGTRSWQVGETWLTLLAGGDGAPRNVEVPLLAASPAEAERLQAAFIAAGGDGPAPNDELMHVPVRFCPVTDAFGTALLVYAPLD